MCSLSSIRDSAIKFIEFRLQYDDPHLDGIDEKGVVSTGENGDLKNPRGFDVRFKKGDFTNGPDSSIGKQLGWTGCPSRPETGYPDISIIS